MINFYRVFSVILLVLLLANTLVSPVVAFWPFDQLFGEKLHYAPPVEFYDNSLLPAAGNVCDVGVGLAPQIDDVWIETYDGTRLGAGYDGLLYRACFHVINTDDVQDPKFLIWYKNPDTDYTDWDAYDEVSADYFAPDTYAANLGYLSFNGDPTSLRPQPMKFVAQFFDGGIHQRNTALFDLYHKPAPRITSVAYEQTSDGFLKIKPTINWAYASSSGYQIYFFFRPSDGTNTSSYTWRDSGHRGSVMYTFIFDGVIGTPPGPAVPYDTPGYVLIVATASNGGSYEIKKDLPGVPPPEVKHLVKIGFSDGGTTVPDNDQEVVDGSSLAIQIKPNAQDGYYCDYITVKEGDADPQKYDPPSNLIYTFSRVLEPYTFYAHFALAQPSPKITVNYGDHGHTDPGKGDHYATYGEDFRIVVSPDSGYQVDQVLLDSKPVSYAAYPDPFVIPNVLVDHSVDFSFKLIPPVMHHITAQASIGGKVDPQSADVIHGQPSPEFFASKDYDDYVFRGWRVDGDVHYLFTKNPYQFNSVVGDHTLYAVFTDEGSLPFPTYPVPTGSPVQRHSRERLLNVSWLNYTLESFYPPPDGLRASSPRDELDRFIWGLGIPTPYEFYVWMRGSAGTAHLPASQQMRDQLATEAADDSSTNPFVEITHGCQFIATQEHEFMQYILSLVRDNPFMHISLALSDIFAKVVPGFIWNFLAVVIAVVAFGRVAKTWMR